MSMGKAFSEALIFAGPSAIPLAIYRFIRVYRSPGSDWSVLCTCPIHPSIHHGYVTPLPSRLIYFVVKRVRRPLLRETFHLFSTYILISKYWDR